MNKFLSPALLALVCTFSGCGGSTPQVVVEPPPILPKTPDERASNIVSQMTQQEKLQMVHGNLTLENGVGPHGAVGWVPSVSRLSIPDLLYADASTLSATTALPSSLAAAATWDPTEARKYGQVIGKEVSVSGMNASLLGNVNLTAREPRDGRTFETKGEDPILAGRMVAAQLQGTQDQYVLTGPKHFAVNDQETGRFHANAVIDERAARESDLLAFEIGLKDSGAQMVMCAYNQVNGAASCASDHLLNKVLKSDWGFQGFVFSDWYATTDGVPAALAGLDQEQPGNYMFGGIWSSESLESALAKGDMPAARLDDMVHRILRAMITAGLFDHPAQGQAMDAAGDAGIAQEIEEQGAVLLKNAGAQLPLPASLSKIAVIGSHADVGVLSGGGSAQFYPVGGAALTLPPACPPYTPPPGGTACTSSKQIYAPSSPFAAIRGHAPSATVTFSDGTDIVAAAALAQVSDVAIIFVHRWESEGMDLVDLGLPENQDALVAAVASANPHTVIVLENGGPVTMPWLGSVSAVLEAWYPGQKGGEAIANLLFGVVNPSGKLPITFPAAVADLPRPTIPIPKPPDSTATFNVDYGVDGFNVGYKWYDAKSIAPLFPFGFGLSYTKFAITNLQLTATSPATNGFQVSFDVQNTGNVAGAETPQVYLALPTSAGEAPRRLVGWTKVVLQAGATQHVTLSVNAADSSHPLSTWDTASDAWITPNGHYSVYVGNSSAAGVLALAGIFDIGS